MWVPWHDCRRDRLVFRHVLTNSGSSAQAASEKGQTRDLNEIVIFIDIENRGYIKLIGVAMHHRTDI